MTRREAAQLKKDFWAHYLKRYPSAPFPARFQEGKPYSNPWFLLRNRDIAVKLWHGSVSVGVYVTGSPGRLAPYREQFDKITNYHLPKEAPQTAIYANTFRAEDTYDPQNWDKLVDFLEAYRRKYLEILTPSPDDAVTITT